MIWNHSCILNASIFAQCFCLAQDPEESKPKRAWDEKSCKALFEKYKDKDDDVISFDGIEALCVDLGKAPLISCFALADQITCSD